MTGPTLPTKFPCWCRAVYSWGGETDRDLGFIEGDLIECLNAGDGSWWMGRLRRDKRMIGLFPSNFVTVLQDDFVPISRSVSPAPSQQSQVDARKQALEKIEQKKEMAKKRRPFQGYKTATTPMGSGRQTQPVKPVQKEEKFDPANPPSTVLWQIPRSRSASPMPQLQEIGSSPPPPPPPHRILGEGISGAASPQPQMYEDDYATTGRTPSPAPPSMNGHTPPMIRNAIDDVMSSLEDMGVAQQDEQEEHEEFNPWSPEAFDNFRTAPHRPPARPVTSLGLEAGGSMYGSETRMSYSSRHNSPDRYQDGPPQLETYVQRMESRLRRQQEAREGRNSDGLGSDPPEPPPKNSPWMNRPTSSLAARRPSVRQRQSAYELGRNSIGRTYTTKTNSTNSSSGQRSVATNSSNQTSMTSQSIMSGQSAGGFSATSAGSLARKRSGLGSIRDRMVGRPLTSAGTRAEQQAQWDAPRPITPGTGVSYHSSHDSRAGARSAVAWQEIERPSTSGGLGGFSTPKPTKRGFFKKLVDSAKASAASARTTIAAPGSTGTSPTKSGFSERITGIAGGMAVSSSPTKSRQGERGSVVDHGRDTAREMGLGGPGSYIASRRDVNRSNTPGPAEKQERANRCRMLDQPVICPVEELYEGTEGDEGADGNPVHQPFLLSNPSFSQIDKAARFITSLPPTTTAANLATGFVCRPYRSDVQRLRAIFIWCAERIAWEEDVDDLAHAEAQVDTRRLIQSRRGSSRELASLVVEMCTAISVHAEVVQGYLKSPGGDLDLDAANRPNHYWNAVIVDGEWRVIDCSLASPTNPRRSLYSNVSTSIAEAWYFLCRPSEIAWTHVPYDPNQQHLVPAVSPDTLIALPGVCPPFFRQNLFMHAYDTSLLRLEGLEVCTIMVNVPTDTEIVAEVETKSYLKDNDGDVYDTDEVTRKRVLAQPSWYRPNPASEILQKRFVIKAVLSGDEGQGILKVYAGKKGLMHTSRDIVHPLAVALPIYHTGENPPFDFVKRHPTPHATRQDLYVVQPQCHRLGVGETYVFCVRQHTASTVTTPAVEQTGFDFRSAAESITRPGSAMSMTSSAAGSNQGSNSSNEPIGAGVKVKEKPAKLAIQSPSGKIMRLNRKQEGLPQALASKEVDGEVQGSAWETVVKVQERGTWRGLVLADRSVRWCVWGEWEAL